MDQHTDHLRFTVMLAEIEIMGIGVALFKLSLMGNDPHTALMIALGDQLGVDFSLVYLRQIVFGFYWNGVWPAFLDSIFVMAMIFLQ